MALVSAQSAQAQSGHYGYDNRGHGHERRAPTWWDQRDRPGDYRCDAYWDANRTDCHERWRDQRPRHVDNRGYRDQGHYGYGHPGYAQRHDYQLYASTVRGPNVWPGAYGRPDLVYPGAGYGQAGGRDARRVDWCRATYRSYDPGSGYYRAYSGRLVYCG
ncbi:BA14K family protein [Brevundimonas sp.]|uniref:BA14K family protein n=1 Tax=Brevundimonas sp. TaxID=1871086 RepID=UPI00391C30F4